MIQTHAEQNTIHKDRNRMTVTVLEVHDLSNHTVEHETWVTVTRF